MPATYELDNERGLLHVRASGPVDAAMFAALRSRLHADEVFRAQPLVLVDLSEVTLFEIEAGEVGALAADRSGAALMQPGTRIAIVAPSGEGFGLSRMYQLSRGETLEQIRVFSDVAAAEEWLGLPGQS